MAEPAPLRSHHGGLAGGKLAGVLAVAATYVYFLLFAQFAFLDQLQANLGAGQVQAAMAVMGLAGLAGSFATAFGLGRLPWRRLLAAGFATSALAALATPWARAAIVLMALAVAIGAATALSTVVLAARLRELVPGKSFGLAVGLGTALAYLVSNLPPLFEGSVALRSVVAAGFCLLGLAAVARAPARAEAAGGATSCVVPADGRGFGLASLVLSFLVLVWLDSAAFAIIQETASLKGATWGSAGQKLLQGGTHALAAIAAGAWLDHRRIRPLLFATFACFAVAFSQLLGGDAPGWAGPLYAVGISLYSVALVAFPSAGPEGQGLVPRRYRAALVYGIGGWLGSALGVGMAQELARIPPAFLVAAGASLALSWLLSRRQVALPLLRTHAWTLALALPAALVVGLADRGAGEAASDPAGAISRGRQVYVSEGCIACHSQYVRPNTRDTELWGPHRPLDRSVAPPLVGSRRQGPDLSNVGLRRSAEWQRRHLEDPGALSPGSRMPNYAHLFGSSDTRGDDLVAYLGSLGTELRAELGP